MRVTAIRQTAPGRLTVGFEDGSELRSTPGAVTDLRLFSGKDLDEDQLEELRLLSKRSIAREQALELVSRRMLSRKELFDKLIRKGEDEATADYCVRWLSEQGFLHDESYAAAVARHYAAKGYGQGRVRAELGRRGIPRQLWDEALEEMPEPDDRLDRLIAARLKDPEDRDAVRRLSAFLFRRGYSWEEIRSALRRYHAETED